MKRVVFASFLIAAFAGSAFAQAQPAPAAKPAAKSAAKKEAPTAGRRQAIEEATPTEDYDPSDKLSPEEVAIAKRVHVGEMPCELGDKVSVKPLKREGFFLVSRGVNRFVMHPVESRTGAIRLEDPARGALWLQLGNKSMLMN